MIILRIIMIIKLTDIRAGPPTIIIFKIIMLIQIILRILMTILIIKPTDMRAGPATLTLEIWSILELHSSPRS